MNMDMILFHSVWTLSLLVLFVAIWAWAWSGNRKRSFDAAARLPLDDEAPYVTPAKKPAKRSGKNLKSSSKRQRTVRKNG